MLKQRIRRQLSLQTNHTHLQELAPTRGDIDWRRTLTENCHTTPGQPPLQFHTRLRQRNTATLENLLTVAILLAYRTVLQGAQREGLGEEALANRELQILVGVDERVERELAAPYARALIEEARQCDIAALAEQVEMQLRPGSSPYRDLIHWWQRFKLLRVGRADDEEADTLASVRSDKKLEAWLYELWIALEFAHLLDKEQALQAEDTHVAGDLLQFTFTWKGRRFQFIYNRQREESAGEAARWENAPATRPDYTIERIEPLVISHNGTEIWREPPVVLDAKYYLDDNLAKRTHGPIRKLLSDMALLSVNQVILFFPSLPVPQAGEHFSKAVKPKTRHHHAGWQQEQQLLLYELKPNMPVEIIQNRLRSVLDHAERHLPERAEPICEGIWLDTDTSNASARLTPPNKILCPKRHIGSRIFDLVDAEQDCLKNPLVCHAINQRITRPEIIRVTTRDELLRKSQQARRRGDEMLGQAEQAGDEEGAEQIRTQVLNGIGQAVEHYVKLRGNTSAIEDMFKQWIFKGYWQEGARGLAKESCNMLVSGEYVWHEYQATALDDWAAPAVQYCRALEFEVKRRIYHHHPAVPKGSRASLTAFKVSGAGWTLGTLQRLYNERQMPKGDDAHNWQILSGVLTHARCDHNEFINLLASLVSGNVVLHRNHLAHGDPVARTIAEELREKIIGNGQQPGILCWITQHLDPH